MMNNEWREEKRVARELNRIEQREGEDCIFFPEYLIINNLRLLFEVVAVGRMERSNRKKTYTHHREEESFTYLDSLELDFLYFFISKNNVSLPFRLAREISTLHPNSDQQKMLSLVQFSTTNTTQIIQPKFLTSCTNLQYMQLTWARRNKRNKTRRRSTKKIVKNERRDNNFFRQAMPCSISLL